MIDRKRETLNKVWLETHIWHAKRFHMSETIRLQVATFRKLQEQTGYLQVFK
jgi:hypothetical protein